MAANLSLLAWIGQALANYAIPLMTTKCMAGPARFRMAAAGTAGFRFGEAQTMLSRLPITGQGQMEFRGMLPNGQHPKAAELQSPTFKTMKEDFTSRPLFVRF